MSSEESSKVIRTNALFGTTKRRLMNKKERLAFIDYMFEHLPEMKLSSKKNISRTLTDDYKELHPDLKINETWVYRLLLAGIYKDEEGNYDFENIEGCTVKEACSCPAALEAAMRRK